MLIELDALDEDHLLVTGLNIKCYDRIVVYEQAN